MLILPESGRVSAISLQIRFEDSPVQRGVIQSA
jgi:hypothetical protein